MIPIIICRAVIIGVKYGYYSDDHLKILNTFKLSNEFLLSNLIGIVLNENKPEQILKKLKDVMYNLKIDIN